MGRPRVACDLDGCVTEFLSAAIEYWGEPDIPVAYSLEEMWPMVPDDDLQGWVDYPSVYENLAPIERAVESIRELSRRGFRFTFITSRAPHLSKVTVKWLRKYGLEYPVVFTLEKAVEIEKGRFNIAIEDNLVVARAIAQVCKKTFLIDHPYNNGPCGRAMRCSSWEEIVALLKGDM